MMGALTITHTPAEGTLLDGTARGDGSADIVKAHGFRWGRSIGFWFRPHSRDRAPELYTINRLADALRGAGFEVAIEIDAGPRPAEEAEADRTDRMEDRADALSAKAERLSATADAHRDRARAAVEHIPMGQPILLGHHSQRRHERALDTFDRNMRASIQVGREANEAAHGAQAAERHMARREAPVTVANRIKKLEADERRIGRAMTPCATSGRRLKPHAEGGTVTCPVCYTDHDIGADLLMPEHGAATGDYLAQLEANLAHTREQLRYWREARDAQVAEGTATNFGPADVRKGDRVRVRDCLHEVVRVNPQSVSVRTPYSWTDTVRYERISEVVRAART